LRTNLCGQEPAELWQFYIQLTEIEATFRTLKDDLGLRPIYHRLEQRTEAHIFVSFLAYCLHVTLRARLKPLAGGLTPRAVLDKFAAIQMLDVHFPTTDGRTLILSRYTDLGSDQKIFSRAARVSALGIKEQRVHMTIDFLNPPDAWSRPGHDYRVGCARHDLERRQCAHIARGCTFPQG